MNIVMTKPRGALVVKDAAKAFCDDVLAGLLADPKRVPPKYFYDETGSQLFQRITALPEYYLTRTETGILERHADEIAKLIPPDAAMVEFGAGSSTKTRILLRAASNVSAYVPVDISGAYLAVETAQLQQEMPTIRVLPVAADFTKPFIKFNAFNLTDHRAFTWASSSPFLAASAGTEYDVNGTKLYASPATYSILQDRTYMITFGVSIR